MKFAYSKWNMLYAQIKSILNNDNSLYQKEEKCLPQFCWEFLQNIPDKDKTFQHYSLQNENKNAV